MRVLMGLILWSMIEIALFVIVGSRIGVLGTLLIVLGSGVAGVMVLRWQGARLGQRLRQDLGAMRDPASPVAHSALKGLAAVLLILPGFLTDLIGLALLVRPVREVIIGRVGKRLQAAARATGGMRPPYEDDVVEAVAVEVQRERPQEPSGWTKP
jgi:UPF0716 protein FxsA